MIDRRRADLGRHLEDLRRADGWHPFQNFVLGLLHHDNYTDVRHSNVRSDYGRDAVAVTPDGKRCVVAVSYDCSKAKVLADAKRSLENPEREEAEILLFVTADAPAETTWSEWKAAVAELGLELRMFHRETILEIATRDEVWRETCARLGISGDRPGYRLVAPYDGEVVRAALQARPAEWLGRRIELREWAGLSGEVRSRIVLGKPGAGKTTTLFVHLEQARPPKVLVVEPDLREGKVEELLDHAAGGGVIVFDDAHEKPNELRALLSALRARQRDREVGERYRGVHLLLAARSQEWAETVRQLSPTELQDLGLLRAAQVQLGALSLAQCLELVEACRDDWGLVIEPRLLEHAAAAAAERDATPLYVLSMLAPARAREDRTLRDEHLAHLPSHVLDLWRLYWSRLSPVQQGVLRLVKLFAVTNAPQRLDLFAAAARAFSLSPHDLSASLDELAAALWVSRTGVLPSCLDVQLEAIPLSDPDLALWDEFAHEVSTDVAAKGQLHLGTGTFYMEVRVQRSRLYDERTGAVQAAERHFYSAVGLAGGSDSLLRAAALNNLSVCIAELAMLEATREGRAAWLQNAVKAVEESVAIFREMGARGDLAMSLNNASLRYGDLAKLETTREGRAALLQKAVDAVEEAIAVSQGLVVQSDLARLLNNISPYYATLAGLETTREGRAAWLHKAVNAGEEAVAIYRELGVQSELATSLNNVSNNYSVLAELETTQDGSAEWLQKAVNAAEESVAIQRELDMQGDLARSLNNVSVHYSRLAGWEMTWEGRTVWLRKAADAAEESVSIRRKLGQQGDLALSLNNVSIRYRSLAELEIERRARASLLQKAVSAVEEAVSIRRELGVGLDLAMSLGSSCRHLRACAQENEDLVTKLNLLRASRNAVEEASSLFRAVGEMVYLVMALQDLAEAHVLLADAGDPLDVDAVRRLCIEGKHLAEQMEDEARIAYFGDILNVLSEPGA